MICVFHILFCLCEILGVKEEFSDSRIWIILRPQLLRSTVPMSQFYVGQRECLRMPMWTTTIPEITFKHAQLVMLSQSATQDSCPASVGLDQESIGQFKKCLRVCNSWNDVIPLTCVSCPSPHLLTVCIQAWLHCSLSDCSVCLVCLSSVSVICLNLTCLDGCQMTCTFASFTAW